MLDEDGIPTPEARALVLAEFLKQVAMVPGPSLAKQTFKATLAALDLREEDFGGLIHHAMFALIESALITCSTYDEASRTLTISAETEVTPSKRLTSYLWSDATL